MQERRQSSSRWLLPSPQTASCLSFEDSVSANEQARKESVSQKAPYSVPSGGVGGSTTATGWDRVPRHSAGSCLPSTSGLELECQLTEWSLDAFVRGIQFKQTGEGKETSWIQAQQQPARLNAQDNHNEEQAWPTLALIS